MDPGRIKAIIRDEALKLGFDVVGFAAPEVATTARAGLAQFLAQGFHGEMDWLAERVTKRTSPTELWPEAKSVVMLGLNYAPENDPLPELTARDRGYISVYARGRDYHDLVKGRLKTLGQKIAARWSPALKVFVDTAPVMEKPLAQAGGIGWQGKHTNLVSREFGSWLFLGEIFLDIALPPNTAESNHCGDCRRCLEACPTQAFPGPYRLDARRCISYLTIEHKGHIDADLRPLIGLRVYGCDDCLAVCPWNKFAQAAHDVALKPRSALNAPALAELAQLDDTAFRKMFSASPVKRIGRDRFLRNVLIAIGNSGAKSLAASARARIDDASPLVRAMAIWALKRLDAGAAAVLRETCLVGERDASVRREWEAD